MKTKIGIEFIYGFDSVNFYQQFETHWHKVFDFNEGIAQIKNMHPIKNWEYVTILMEYED